MRIALVSCLAALALGGCLPVLDEDDIETSVEATPEPAAEGSPGTTITKPLVSVVPPTKKMQEVAQRANLDLAIKEAPTEDFGLQVTAEASGPNLVIITATYLPEAPPARPVLPAGARLIGAGEVTPGRSRWEVRPPLKGSHHYGAEITDGERLATASARCCAAARYEAPVDPPPPGAVQDDGVDVMR